MLPPDIGPMQQMTLEPLTRLDTSSAGEVLRILTLDGGTCTVCPGSSDPSEKILNIFASENEDYTVY